ncbi:MAG: type II CRISPR-associated endonuclease Cas1 [Bryobacteraceae bacterium]|nr:type II CRISPR-associated endonuclease Cas1 [Bryobacteraceae bacterium]
MTDRILDFSQEPSRLSIRNGLLVVTQGTEEVEAIPCAEIACVLVSHPAVVFTQAVLSHLTEAGAAFVICDSSQRPAGMLLPLQSHHVQAGRFARQTTLTKPRRKRMWQQLVRAKIEAQARVLEEKLGGDAGLRALKKRVASGDTTNVEARAARRYWQLLFDEFGFKRRNDEDHRNHWLNYGYAVLRAMTARAICACGLHPTFGIAHRNKANAFALADDLMEPFRPLVDRFVAGSDMTPLTGEAKRNLIAAVSGRLLVANESRTMFDVLTKLAQSVVAVIMGEAAELWLPPWSPLPRSGRGNRQMIRPKARA